MHNSCDPKIPVRVRFAPSPTGHLHIGGVRTALFNWLFAHHYQGTFLLRIEDTDFERSKPEYTDSILSSFAWMNIHADEPLVYQSDRLDMYKQVAEQLLKEGKAYRCFCAPDDHIKRYQKAHGNAALPENIFIKYDGFCRAKQVTAADLERPHVIRFKLPDTLTDITVNDLIRGPILFHKDQLDDFVIMRNDGWPMYNFAVVVDDAMMRISHVIRGEEHIVNTPKQILVYDACEYTVPQFAHVPVILGPSGNKLSKREGATSIVEYRHMGYVAEALINYLVRLGWSHGDQEIFTIQELIQYFSLEHVGKKAAIFDIQKLTWVNSVYIRQLDNVELRRRINADIITDFDLRIVSWPPALIAAVIGLYKERVNTLLELAHAILLLHDGPAHFNPDDLKTWVTADTQRYLPLLIQKLEGLIDFRVDLIKDTVKILCKENSINLVSLAQPIRIALIGSSGGPGAFELLAIVGKEEALKRIQHLIKVCEYLDQKK
jgi:glutamyl-tRNA synthetase